MSNATFKLFCRHCWKKVAPIYRDNEHHVEARCPDCKNWIKFLNRSEIVKLLLEKIGTSAPKLIRQRMRHGY